MIYEKSNITGTEKEILELISKLDIPFTIRLAENRDEGVDFSRNTCSLLFPEYQAIPQKLDLVKVSKYLRQLLEALKALHQNNILHLDCTKANVLYDSTRDQIVLIDFGLSMIHSNKGEQSDKVGCGTLGYIAPEVLDRGLVSSAADLYSSGVLFGQWLEPFIPDCSLNYLGSSLVRPSTTTFISRKLRDSLDSQLINPSIPQWPPTISYAADLLSKMLDPDMNSRITAAEALRHPFLNSPDTLFKGTEYNSFSELWRKSRCGIPWQRSKGPIVVYKSR